MVKANKFPLIFDWAWLITDPQCIECEDWDSQRIEKEPRELNTKVSTSCWWALLGGRTSEKAPSGRCWIGNLENRMLVLPCPQLVMWTSIFLSLKWVNWETFLDIQWLGLHAFTAEGMGLIPGWGTKIPQAVWYSKKKKKKKKSKINSELEKTVNKMSELRS